MKSGEKQSKYVLKRRLFNKYNADEVDAYCDAMYKKLKSLQAENASLVEKVEVLTQRLDDFRDKEDSIRNALVTAEKVSDLCIKESKTRAEKIVSQATAESKKIVDEITYKAIEQKDILLKMQKYVRDYQNKLLLSLNNLLGYFKNFMNKDPNYDSLCADVMKVLEQSDGGSVDIASSSFAGPEVSEASSSEGESFEKSTKSELMVDDEPATINEKFKDLKFGENYPSSSREKKHLFGMFKKVR